MRTIRNRYADPVFVPTSIPLRRAVARNVEVLGRWFTAEAKPYIVAFCQLAVAVVALGLVCGLVIGLAR